MTGFGREKISPELAGYVQHHHSIIDERKKRKISKKRIIYFTFGNCLFEKICINEDKKMKNNRIIRPF